MIQNGIINNFDYKEKYNKLVEAVKVLQETNPSDKGIQNWVNDNVPELRKSEDEKIRIALINVFATHKDYEMFFGVSVEDIQAWLERQGEHAVACSEEQMKVLNEVLNFAANHESPYWNDYIFETLNNLIRQLKKLKRE
jgi:TusA-related sulfurtransferase